MNKLVPLSLMGVILATYSFTGIKKENTNIKKHLDKTANVVAKSDKKATKNSTKKNAQKDKNIVQKSEEEQLPDVGKMVEEPVIEQETEENRSMEQEEPKIEDNSFYETRLTSYHTNDGSSGNCTGSGLCTNDFQVNENGWYTYQGKLVVATATEYLLKYGFSLADGVHTYRYYDEIVLNIDGIDYQAIVTDSCGNCMRTGRIDLFVSGSWAVKDTIITVKE